MLACCYSKADGDTRGNVGEIHLVRRMTHKGAKLMLASGLKRSKQDVRYYQRERLKLVLGFRVYKANETIQHNTMKASPLFFILSVIALVSGAGCNSGLNSDIDAVEVTGTVRSSFENFSFTPSGSLESYWINDYDYKTGKYYAENWELLKDIHQSLLEKEADLRAAKLPIPIIYICISGSAVIQSHKNGVGHMNGWQSDITFNELSSAKVGPYANPGN